MGRCVWDGLKKNLLLDSDCLTHKSVKGSKSKDLNWIYSLFGKDWSCYIFGIPHARRLLSVTEDEEKAELLMHVPSATWCSKTLVISLVGFQVNARAAVMRQLCRVGGWRDRMKLQKEAPRQGHLLIFSGLS